MPHKETDLTYLAGLIDGEGCFSIVKSRTAFVPRILIVNTNKQLMVWLKRMFGGDVSCTVVKNHPKWKPRYQWRLANRKALDLAYAICDKLIIKRDAAMVFATYRAIIDVFPNKFERRELHQYLSDKLHEFNCKGILDANT